ncbi:hypothetical protein Vadar_031233 [Vaccinium darrowii]|uniref:Uncharacterized protein n=1 Tax=Vaccinium darrowii TaxID=229202 RepID=A0ACB7YHB5_9ERIC|nr:hypothetical protein Vadar_031233 [Vaccinium darrowii]
MSLHTFEESVFERYPRNFISEFKFNASCVDQASGNDVFIEDIVSCIYHYSGSCFAAYSRVEKTGKYIGAGWEKCFDEAYSELWKKVNPSVCANDSGDKESATHNTYLVVSILVAASGIHKLPAINSYSDLDKGP